MEKIHTETQIKSTWKYQSPPLVTISCNTYNQEQYISDAIESFLFQKTTFPFEILVHDDASTDSTPNILKQYEIKYPSIIKVLYQKQNQMSQGVKIFNFIFPHFLGKYRAVCEGDDYWNDPLKLEKQIDILEKDPKSIACFHPAFRMHSTKNENPKIQGYIGNKIRKISTEEIFDRGIGFMPTCSLVIKKEFYTEPLVASFFENHGGSFFSKLFPSYFGTVYYLPDIMSSHRINANGSYSRRFASDAAFAIQATRKVDNAFKVFDLVTEYKYHKKILKKRKGNAIRVLFRTDISNELFEMERLYYSDLISPFLHMAIHHKLYKKIYISIRRVYSIPAHIKNILTSL